MRGRIRSSIRSPYKSRKVRETSRTFLISCITGNTRKRGTGCPHFSMADRQELRYFRGAADVARKEQVQMHNRWDLEFDTEMIPGYNTLMDFSGKRLAEGCQWSERMLQEFSARVQTLTPTERVILQLFIEGCDIHEAAARAFISVGTARKHNTNINKKLCVSTREELMLYIDLFRRCDRLEELIYQN